MKLVYFVWSILLLLSLSPSLIVLSLYSSVSSFSPFSLFPSGTSSFSLEFFFFSLSQFCCPFQINISFLLSLSFCYCFFLLFLLFFFSFLFFPACFCFISFRLELIHNSNSSLSLFLCSSFPSDYRSNCARWRSGRNAQGGSRSIEFHNVFERLRRSYRRRRQL